MKKALAGLNIVVTRPAHQAEPLCKLIEQQAGTAIRFPVLAIAEPRDQNAVTALLSRISDFDIAIFISPNAVTHGLKMLAPLGGLPDNILISAVGQTTAKTLEANDCPVHIFPELQFNSEALLAMQQLQQVSGKKVLIFRGEGGRELLADTLRSRGASVEYAECYRRIKPNTDTGPLLTHWAADKIDAIIVTSNDGLGNLVDMVGDAAQSDLLKTQLLVVSERTVAHAKQLGFTQTPIIAKKASDQDVLQALIEWQENMAK